MVGVKEFQGRCKGGPGGSATGGYPNHGPHLFRGVEIRSALKDGRTQVVRLGCDRLSPAVEIQDGEGKVVGLSGLGESDAAVLRRVSGLEEG